MAARSRARYIGYRLPMPCLPRSACTTSFSRAPTRTLRTLPTTSMPAHARSSPRPASNPCWQRYEPGEAVQFERQGYFCLDTDSRPGQLVFNRTVGLRDTWAKVQGGRSTASAVGSTREMTASDHVSWTPPGYSKVLLSCAIVPSELVRAVGARDGKAGPSTRTRRDLAPMAGRGRTQACPGMVELAHRSCAPHRPAVACMGGDRGRTRSAGAVACDRIRQRRRHLFRHRAGARPLGNRAPAGRHHCSFDPAPGAAIRLSTRTGPSGGGGRLCHRHHQACRHRPSGARDPALERRGRRLRRGAGRARTLRPCRRAGRADRRAAPGGEARAGARVGAQGYGAGHRQLRRVQGTVVAAARALATGRLRLRARPLLPAHRRIGLRARADPHGRASGAPSAEAAVRYGHRRHA